MTDEKYSDPVLRSALNDVVFGRALQPSVIGHLSSIGPRLPYLGYLRQAPRDRHQIRVARDDLQLMNVLSGTNVPGAHRRLRHVYRRMLRERMFRRYQTPWLNLSNRSWINRFSRVERRSWRRRRPGSAYGNNMMNYIRGLYE